MFRSKSLLLFFLLLPTFNFAGIDQNFFVRFFTLRRVLAVSTITLICVYKIMSEKIDNMNHEQNCDCVDCVGSI